MVCSRIEQHGSFGDCHLSWAGGELDMTQGTTRKPYVCLMPNWGSAKAQPKYGNTDLDGPDALHSSCWQEIGCCRVPSVKLICLMASRVCLWLATPDCRLTNESSQGHLPLLVGLQPYHAPLAPRRKTAELCCEVAQLPACVYYDLQPSRKHVHSMLTPCRLGGGLCWRADGPITPESPGNPDCAPT